jgi:small-conductance mechanosensitive channel
MLRALEAFRRRVMDDPMQVLIPLAIFAGVFLAAWIARRVILRALDAWQTRKGSRPGRIVYDAVRGPTRIWIVILAAHLAFQGSQVPAGFALWESNVLLVLWIFSLTVMCMKLAGDLVRQYGDQVPGALPVTTLSQNLAEIAVVILGVLIVLGHFNVSVAPLLTALGVGGLAVALALQDTLSNLFGGFYVAIARQVRLGDYIKLNTGEEGYVADIGWRSTTMRALANNMIIVPNAKLAQAIITNYSLPEKRTGTSIVVTVGYECDPDAVETILSAELSQAAKEVPGMLGELAPGVGFDPGFADNGYGYTLGFQVAEFADQPKVRNELRRRVARRLRAEGIAMPRPERNLYVKYTGAP